MPPLDPTGRPVTVGIATLSTPGLAGVVEAATEVSESPRRSGGAIEEVDAALERLGFETQETITISDAAEGEGASEGTRFTLNDEPAIELVVPAPAEDARQVVLAVDEAGVVAWHFGLEQEDRIDASGRAMRTYLIRRRVPNPPAGPARRGLVGRFRAKVIRVLTIRVIGDIANYLAASWELLCRPYSLRRFDPDNFTRWLPPGSVPVWNNLATGRALLFIHGTFSRADRAFADFDPQAFARIHEAYGRRVFAFDHPTASADPISNVLWFLSNIPPDIELDLDIVCHSRGGLVSRVLAEHAQDFGVGNRIRVHRTVLVAVPNQGTKLADSQYFIDLLDGFTTLSNLVPMPSPWHIFEAVAAVVRHLLVAGQQRLGGLDCMVPERPFLRWLDSYAPGRRPYFGVASDFEPVGGNEVWNQLKRRVIDRIHGEANDVMVSQSSAFGANGSASFPIAPPELLVYANAAHVDHFSYFKQTMTLDWLLRWLTPVP